MNGVMVLVEDNPTDEKLAVRAFRKSGVERIVVLRDGAEVLEYLFATGRYAGQDIEVPAVVFLDLKLPKLDGLEVLRRVRESARTRLLPIVVLTSSREAEDVATCYALGANAYVRKPLDFAQFSAAVQTLSAFWLRLNLTAPTGGGDL